MKIVLLIFYISFDILVIRDYTISGSSVTSHDHPEEELAIPSGHCRGGRDSCLSCWVLGVKMSIKEGLKQDMITSLKITSSWLGAWLIRMVKINPVRGMRSDLQPTRGALVCRLVYRQVWRRECGCSWPLQHHYKQVHVLVAGCPWHLRASVL